MTLMKHDVLINLAKTRSPIQPPFSPGSLLDLFWCCYRWQRSCHPTCLPPSLPQSPDCHPRCPECVQRPPAQTQAEPLLTSAFEEVAVDILYGGIDGRPSGDTSRSDVRVILGVYILKSFPWDSRMEFWKIPNKMKIKT